MDPNLLGAAILLELESELGEVNRSEVLLRRFWRGTNALEKSLNVAVTVGMINFRALADRNEYGPSSKFDVCRSSRRFSTGPGILTILRPSDFEVGRRGVLKM